MECLRECFENVRFLKYLDIVAALTMQPSITLLPQCNDLVKPVYVQPLYVWQWQCALKLRVFTSVLLGHDLMTMSRDQQCWYLSPNAVIVCR